MANSAEKKIATKIKIELVFNFNGRDPNMIILCSETMIAESWKELILEILKNKGYITDDTGMEMPQVTFLETIDWLNQIGESKCNVEFAVKSSTTAHNQFYVLMKNFLNHVKYIKDYIVVI